MKVTVKDGLDLNQIGSGLAPRSEGLHLSEVIRSLSTTLGLNRRKQESGWQMGPTQAVGLLWEEVLSQALRNCLAHRIGEVKLDDIIMTPDGFDPSIWALEEYKATWKSSRKDVTEFWEWLVQIKSYCHALATNLCVLRVLFINGPYDFANGGPVDRVYELEFTDQELVENWQMVLNHANQMRGSQ